MKKELRMSSASNSNSQTRRQLDELDALLERMLALPLSHLESSASARAAVDVDIPLPPTRTSFSEPVIRPTQPVEAPRPGEPTVQAWRVEMPATEPLSSEASASANIPSPLIFGQGISQASNEAFIPDSSPAPVPTFSPSSLSARIETSPTTTVAPPLPVVLWPIWLLNALFDAFACLFGPFGRWLTYPSVRNLMGWTGILMMLGAIGWALAEWYGIDWTR
jgi:hypothetical protein